MPCDITTNNMQGQQSVPILLSVAKLPFSQSIVCSLFYPIEMQCLRSHSDSQQSITSSNNIAGTQ
jgi:hypothetical protein